MKRSVFLVLFAVALLGTAVVVAPASPVAAEEPSVEELMSACIAAGGIFYGEADGSFRCEPAVITAPAGPCQSEPAAAPEPTEECLAWHGRWVPEVNRGYEYLVLYPSCDYVGSLQFWATLPDDVYAEFGNDSLKGWDLVATYYNAMVGFPASSWLDMPALTVWSDDIGGPNGQSWKVNGPVEVPAEFTWLMQNATAVDLPTFWVDDTEAPFRIIAWIPSDEAPDWVTQ